jgi:predicted lipoprotein with Yx(FWY)xxD motif
MRIRPAIPVLAAGAVLALAACTSGSGATQSPSATATPTQAASPSATSESPSAGEATVMVADSDLGQILVDGKGMTLYLFTPDEAGTPTCYDGCAQAWPPLLADGEVSVGEGLDDSDFSTAARTDGGDQVKVGNWPLYYFANDKAPGDTNGQGLNGKWYVVSPTGEAIK